jgi:hypothetical protein
MSTTNESLLYLSIAWKMDGDLMRCCGCSRGVIASRWNEEPQHASACLRAGYMDNRNPWLILKDIIDSSDMEAKSGT